MISSKPYHSEQLLKSGRTSAPRLPQAEQMNRTSLSEILHLLEQLIDIGHPQLAMSRWQIRLQQVRCVTGNSVALDRARLGEIGAHGFDEGARATAGGTSNCFRGIV